MVSFAILHLGLHALSNLRSENQANMYIIIQYKCVKNIMNDPNYFHHLVWETCLCIQNSFSYHKKQLFESPTEIISRYHFVLTLKEALTKKVWLEPIFLGDYYELEPQAQRSIALIAQHHVKRPFPLQITNYIQNLYSRLREFQANCSVIQREIWLLAVVKATILPLRISGKEK